MHLSITKRTVLLLVLLPLVIATASAKDDEILRVMPRTSHGAMVIWDLKSIFGLAAISDPSYDFQVFIDSIAEDPSSSFYQHINFERPIALALLSKQDRSEMNTMGIALYLPLKDPNQSISSLVRPEEFASGTLTKIGGYLELGINTKPSLLRGFAFPNNYYKTSDDLTLLFNSQSIIRDEPSFSIAQISQALGSLGIENTPSQNSSLLNQALDFIIKQTNQFGFSVSTSDEFYLVAKGTPSPQSLLATYTSPGTSGTLSLGDVYLDSWDMNFGISLGSTPNSPLKTALAMLIPLIPQDSNNFGRIVGELLRAIGDKVRLNIAINQFLTNTPNFLMAMDMAASTTVENVITTLESFPDNRFTKVEEPGFSFYRSLSDEGTMIASQGSTLFMANNQSTSFGFQGSMFTRIKPSNTIPPYLRGISQFIGRQNTAILHMGTKVIELSLRNSNPNAPISLTDESTMLVWLNTNNNAVELGMWFDKTVMGTFARLQQGAK